MKLTNHDEQAGQNGPGERLRRVREKAGLTRQDVANRLRLNADWIAAMERNDYAQLPRAIFVRGYYRAYAEPLQEPADDIIQEYNRSAPAETPSVIQPSLKAPIKPFVRLNLRIAPWVTVLVIILLIGLAMLAWHNERGLEQNAIVKTIAVQQSAGNSAGQTIAPPTVPSASTADTMEQADSQQAAAAQAPVVKAPPKPAPAANQDTGADNAVNNTNQENE